MGEDDGTVSGGGAAGLSARVRAAVVEVGGDGDVVKFSFGMLCGQDGSGSGSS